MSARAVALAVSIALVAASPFTARANSSPAPSDAHSSLDRGRQAFKHGDYDNVVKTITPLLYPHVELETEDLVVDAHRLLAISFLFLKKNEQAEQEVSSLLVLRPNFELDPVAETPEAVVFFQGVRRKQEERLREIRERQRQDDERARLLREKKQAEARRLAERVYVDRAVARNSRLLAMIPFGVGQAQNRQLGKAIAFGVGEVSLAAISIGAWVALGQRYPGNKVPSADKPYATGLLSLQLAAGVAFWAVVAWGIIDAQVKFVPEVVLRTKDLPSAPPKMTVAPILSPGFYGLGVQGVF